MAISDLRCAVLLRLCQVWAGVRGSCWWGSACTFIWWSVSCIEYLVAHVILLSHIILLYAVAHDGAVVGLVFSKKLDTSVSTRTEEVIHLSL